MGLATTALMQVHVGSRGGAFLLEHFDDLASAKKMDAPAFKAALDVENRYVTQKAMLPPTTAQVKDQQKSQPYTPVVGDRPINKGGKVVGYLSTDGTRHSF
jgi:hypothetical protein